MLDFEASIYCVAFISMKSDVKAVWGLSPHVQNYFFKATFIFFIQMGIIVSIGVAALTDEDGLQYEKPKVSFMVMRLLCCYLFHLSNYSDVA